MIIKQLKCGTYLIILEDLNCEIKVEVIKGEYWKENKTFMIPENKANVNI